MYIDPVFQRDDGRWTFYDESWDEFPNSWDIREFAERAYKQYGDFLNTGEVTGSLLLEGGL
jgi:hypothetical protein